MALHHVDAGRRHAQELTAAAQSILLWMSADLETLQTTKSVVTTPISGSSMRQFVSS
jgi:hypothetical protein